MSLLSIIVPVCNEADSVYPFYYELKKHVPKHFELLWIDNGSTDSTLYELEQLTIMDNRCKCIALSRTFSQEGAIAAGLEFASGKQAIIMKADLRHAPSAIPRMLEKMKSDYDCVLHKKSMELNWNNLFDNFKNLFLSNEESSLISAMSFRGINTTYLGYLKKRIALHPEENELFEELPLKIGYTGNPIKDYKHHLKLKKEKTQRKLIVLMIRFYRKNKSLVKPIVQTGTSLIVLTFLSYLVYHLLAGGALQQSFLFVFSALFLAGTQLYNLFKQNTTFNLFKARKKQKDLFEIKEIIEQDTLRYQ
jgi:glycosyltransferase involved in cell wall biosynthesis